MRQVVAFAFLSLDGVAESPDRFFDAWDDVVDKAGEELIATQDAVILGRRSHDEWSAFWPTSDIEPFATFINSVTKYVATSTPLTSEWSNTNVIDGDLVDFLTDLKQQRGQDIGIHASISITQALLTAGQIDQLRLAIAPAVAGSGRRLLDGVSATKLKAIRSQLSPSGYLLADYAPQAQKD